LGGGDGHGGLSAATLAHDGRFRNLRYVHQAKKKLKKSSAGDQSLGKRAHFS
jgi:hypothetical protein